MINMVLPSGVPVAPVISQPAGPVKKRRISPVRGSAASIMLLPSRSYGPLLSVLVIVLGVSCVVALNIEQIMQAALPLFVSVFLLHFFGFLLGYFFAKAAGCKEALCRTISIEVGMQNSGLAAALASKHFAHLAIAPVPAAISAVYHCLIGSLLAGWWRGRNR